MTEIEKILKVNNVSTTASDDDISLVLRGARYNDDEIKQAILELRQGPQTKPNKSEIEGLHKVFRTTTTLNSAEVSSLLGIDIEQKEILIERRRTNEIPYKHLRIVWLLSLLVASLGLFVYMSLTNIHLGPLPLLTLSS